MPQLEAASDVGVQAAPAVNDGVIDRLEGGEPVADLGHMGPGLSGVVVHAGEHPHPAIAAGPGHGGVGAPAHIRRLRDDGAVVGSWFAAAPDPLGRQQPLSAQQPQDPFPAHLDAVLAAEPGADLAGALTSKRRVGEHLADQLHQLGVVDRRHRSRSAWLPTGLAGVDGRAGWAEHPAHHGHRQLVVHG